MYIFSLNIKVHENCWYFKFIYMYSSAYRESFIIKVEYIKI